MLEFKTKNELSPWPANFSRFKNSPNEEITYGFPAVPAPEEKYLVEEREAFGLEEEIVTLRISRPLSAADK